VSAAQFAAFVGVSLLVIVTPGQDTALTIRNSLAGGRSGGVFTAGGVATGQAAWTMATSAGLAALLLASEPAFVALKLIGGAYLVVLGAQLLLHAVRSTAVERGIVGHRRTLSRSAAYRQGLISNLGNPKMAVFFTSLLPQFASSFAGLLTLGLIFSSLTLAWLTLYAQVVDRIGDRLVRPMARRLLDSLTGGVLVALGVRLVSEQR
jgi:threonine/homoserine/homoserine lactone efflux protein